MLQGLKVKRPIVVKVKVTDNFKNQMAAEIQETARKLDAELQQLDFQIKRLVAELEKKNPAGIPAAKQQVESEKHKRLQAKGKLTEQLRNIGKLALGAEVVQGTMESITEINVGDDWNEIMGVEIVVCDNKIIEIRRRSTNLDEPGR
ncbi:MAG: YlqD family protein [Thermincola sp.]|jgi:Skp family chaperone for outer membrane proteins|nr:YlqD family protein [Thermincola sp.]MDT3701497.1 YlqD family protein [Thermincola sp.]